MDQGDEPHIRDRADRLVRGATVGGIGGALAVTGIFSALAALYFSGKPVAAQPSTPPPLVPVAKAPVQARPPVVIHVVHHAGAGRPSAGVPVPRPPAQGPGPPPPPPPPPPCHSTPSKPC